MFSVTSNKSIGVVFILLFLGQFHETAGQRYGSDREFLIGVSNNLFFNDRNGTHLNDGTESNFQRNRFHIPSLDLSLIHDSELFALQVSVPFGTIKPSDDAIENLTVFDFQMGMKVFPRGLRSDAFSPLIGFNVSSIYYMQGSESTRTEASRLKSTAEIGLIYKTPKAYFTMSYNRFLNPRIRMYQSRTEKMETTLAKHFLNAGLHFRVQSLSKMNNGQRKARYIEYIGAKEKYLGWFIGMGVSNGIQVRSSSYLASNYAFVDSFVPPKRFFNYTLGYYFYRKDVTLSFNYRSIEHSRDAFAYEYRLDRTSAQLELTKYLLNGSKLVPLLGVGVSLEKFDIAEFENQNLMAQSTERKLSPSVKIGWEVRPGGKGSWWTLTSNLRYTPFLTTTQQGYAVSHQQVEFNFLQLSLYPFKLAVTK